MLLYLSYFLLAVGLVIFLGPWVGKLFFVVGRLIQGKPPLSDEIEGLPSPESSDIEAPPGFVDHLERIRGVSQSATAEQREAYYFDALTRAETLERENDRLNGVRSPDQPREKKPDSPPAPPKMGGTQ